MHYLCVRYVCVSVFECPSIYFSFSSSLTIYICVCLFMLLILWPRHFSLPKSNLISICGCMCAYAYESCVYMFIKEEFINCFVKLIFLKYLLKILNNKLLVIQAFKARQRDVTLASTLISNTTSNASYMQKSLILKDCLM